MNELDKSECANPECDNSHIWDGNKALIVDKLWWEQLPCFLCEDCGQLVRSDAKIEQYKNFSWTNLLSRVKSHLQGKGKTH